MMGVSWSTIGKPGDPITGRVHRFESLEETFETTTRRIRSVHGDLDGIRWGAGDAQFKGQMADAFRDEISAIDNWMDDLGDISQRFAQIFAQHADQLREIEIQADKALARAQTAWNQRNSAENDREDAEGRLSWIDYQLGQLDDTDGGGQRANLEWQREDAEGDITRARSAETTAIQNLDAERGAWHGFQDQETSLNEATATKLRDVNLEDLANPSWISQQVGKVADFASLVIENWDEILYFLYQVLDWAIMVFSVVAMLLTLTGVLAPLAALLGTIVAWMVVVKFVIGASLIRFSDKISGLDFLADCISLVTLGASTGALHLLKSGRYMTLPISRLSRYAYELTALEWAGTGVGLAEKALPWEIIPWERVSVNPIKLLLPMWPVPLIELKASDTNRCWSDLAPRLEMGTRTLAPTGW